MAASFSKKQVLEALQRFCNGESLEDIAKRLGIETEFAKFKLTVDIDDSELGRLKHENTCLRNLVVELSLEKTMLLESIIDN
jgi:hypothetical protein